MTDQMNNIKLSQGAPEVITLASLKRDDVQAKARELIVELVRNTMQLTKKDVAKWRQSWQMAINRENPKRYMLYQVFADNLVDLHLIGALRQRKLKVMRKALKVVDRKSGKQDDEMTEALKARWFKQYKTLALDSIAWGHSLIQFGDRTTEPQLGFASCTLVPREHVCPEFGTLLKSVSDEGKKGVDYRNKYADWALEVGDPNDLGLLNAVSPHCISKRNMLAFWDQFGELFGMPIRIGKTLSRDPKDVDKISDVLDKMGSAAWGVFPSGTEIEIKETTRGDAFNVYDKRIERSNSEISKGILGVTMTMDDGASKSQGQVHLEVADDVVEADLDWLIDEINDGLFPFLKKHGFKVDGKKVEVDDTYEYSPEEMTDIEDMILEHYEVDDQYFIDKYGITITGKKETAPQDPTAQKKKPTGKSGKKAELTAESDLISLVSEAYKPCPECGGHVITLAMTDDEILKEATIIAKAIITGDVVEGDIMPEIAQKVAELLKKATLEGYSKGFPKVKTGTPEATMLENLENNVYQFSVAKNYQEIKECTKLLVDGDRVRTFNEFKAEVVRLHTLYNKSWLETEYNAAINSAQSAASWVTYQEGKEDMPLLQYRTAGDQRVRDSHAAIDGVKRPIDDDFWNTHYPPNGWNCRCTTVQTSGKETPKNKIPFTKVDKMFMANMAKEGMIFPKDHPYWDGVTDDVLKKAENLKPKKEAK